MYKFTTDLEPLARENPSWYKEDFLETRTNQYGYVLGHLSCERDSTVNKFIFVDTDNVTIYHMESYRPSIAPYFSTEEEVEAWKVSAGKIKYREGDAGYNLAMAKMDAVYREITEALDEYNYSKTNEYGEYPSLIEPPPTLSEQDQESISNLGVF